MDAVKWTILIKLLVLVTGLCLGVTSSGADPIPSTLGVANSTNVTSLNSSTLTNVTSINSSTPTLNSTSSNVASNSSVPITPAANSNSTASTTLTSSQSNSTLLTTPTKSTDSESPTKQSANSSTTPPQANSNVHSATNENYITGNITLTNSNFTNNDSLQFLNALADTLSATVFHLFPNITYPNGKNFTTTATDLISTDESRLNLFRLVAYNFLSGIANAFYNVSEPSRTYTQATSKDTIRAVFYDILDSMNRSMRNYTDEKDQHQVDAVASLFIYFMNGTFSLAYDALEEMLSPTKRLPSNFDKYKFIYIHKQENETALKLIQTVQILDVLNRLRPKNIFLALLPLYIEGRQRIRPVRRIVYNAIQELVEWKPLKVYTKRVNNLIKFISEYPQRSRVRVQHLAHHLTQLSQFPEKVIDTAFKFLLPYETWVDFLAKINDIRFKNMPLRKLRANLKIGRKRLRYDLKPRNVIKYILKAILKSKALDFEANVAGIVLCLEKQVCAIIV